LFFLQILGTNGAVLSSISSPYLDYYKSEIEKIGKEVSCSFCTTRLLALASML